MATSELVWGALPDLRTPYQREADAEIERECRDDPDPLERLRQDALAVCSEYFARLKARNNQAVPNCPGCEALMLEGRDLVGEKIISLLHGELRSKRTKRARFADRQMEMVV